MSLQPMTPAETANEPHPNGAKSPETGLAGVPASPGAAAGANGSLAKATALPKARRGKKTFGFVAPLVLILLVASSAGAYYVFRGPADRTDLSTAVVELRDLQLKVVERGTMEAKDNHDVKCTVKAGSRGAAKIKTVVDNGTMAQVGDLLVEIDDSYLVEQATTKRIDRLKALSEKIAAEELYPVKVKAIELAKKQLEQWIKGDFPQTLHGMEGDIQTSQSSVLQQEDRTAWAARMVKKKYMTASQEEAEQANLTGNKLTLQQNEEKKKVLVEYTDPVKRQTFENNIKEALVAERTAFATMEATKAVFDQQDSLYNDLLTQISQCKVKAPYAGIVVYSVPEQTRFGAGSSQSIIAQGEPVQDGQKMLSIPDLSHMRVRVRIHEAFISHMRTGLKATVRIDALPGRLLRGSVVQVAGVAAQQDWMSPDVKVYECLVEIDGTLSEKNLKPGLSAVCTIFAEDIKVDHVVAVPIQAVVSPLERGGKSRCFVKTPKGPEAREVELGLSDGTYIEIKSGLEAGDVLVMNPRILISDKEKKITARDEDKGGPGGEKGKSGKSKRGPGI